MPGMSEANIPASSPNAANHARRSLSGAILTLAGAIVTTGGSRSPVVAFGVIMAALRTRPLSSVPTRSGGFRLRGFFREMDPKVFADTEPFRAAELVVAIIRGQLGGADREAGGHVERDVGGADDAGSQVVELE